MKTKQNKTKQNKTKQNKTKQNKTKPLIEMDIHHKILLDTIKDIVYFKDAQGRNLIVNKAFEELVGLKEGDIIGKTDKQIFPPDLAECCNFSDRDVFEKGRALRSEEECIGKDGKRMFFDTVKSPVYDEHRKIVGLVGVSRNITEYRQTLEDLQLFKSIINQTNDAVAIVDPETSRFIYVNDEYCSNLGYTRKEMLNMKVTEIEAILPDDFSWSKHVSDVREKGYMLLEGLHRRKDGTTFPVWVNVKFLDIIENNYMVAIVRDITDWKKMQDEMQRLNQELEQRVSDRTAQLEIANKQLKEEIIEHKKDEKLLTLKYSITYILSEFNDPKEALTGTLKAICEYNGWGVGEIWFIDRDANTLSLNSMWHNPAWDVKEFEEVSRGITFQKGSGLPGRVWETEQPAWITDVIVDRNFLRESIASKLGLHGAFAFPIKISGSVAGVMSFFSRSIEPPDNAILQMFDEIGTQIGGFIARRQVEEELQMMRNIESIGTLAGGIAHDFNNLLTAIVGNIYLTKMYLSKKNISPDDEVFKRLKDSEKSCMHAKELTAMLITFAKGGDPIKEPIEISKFLKETATLVIPSNLPITCGFDIPDNLYSVKADKLQIKQVVKGLVVNAVEAMPNGGVIKVRTENITVGENANLLLKDGKYLRVSIEDSGVGIPEENLSKIFDPYFSTKERGSQKGMGLGLSICYSIINRHEGLITVDSKVGVGTTFHFYLPADLTPHPNPLPTGEREG